MLAAHTAVMHSLHCLPPLHFLPLKVCDKGCAPDPCIRVQAQSHFDKGECAGPFRIWIFWGGGWHQKPSFAKHKPQPHVQHLFNSDLSLYQFNCTHNSPHRYLTKWRCYRLYNLWMQTSLFRRFPDFLDFFGTVGTVAITGCPLGPYFELALEKAPVQSQPDVVWSKVIKQIHQHCLLKSWLHGWSTQDDLHFSKCQIGQ